KVYLFDLGGRGVPSGVSVAPVFVVGEREKVGSVMSTVDVGEGVSSGRGAVYGLGREYFYEMPTTGLVSWWKFDGDADDGWGDNDGGCTGSACPSFVSGVADFDKGSDGTVDYINFPANVDTQLQNDVNTISTWANVRTVGPNGYSELYVVGGVAPVMGIQFRRTNIGVLVNALGYGVSVVSNFNQWHHVVIEFDKTVNTYKIYLDGNYIGQAVSPVYGNFGTAIRMGSNSLTGNTGDFMDGQVDNTMLFKRALTSEEIKAIYEIQKK
ncbi:MAG: LamG domain-containing protein, partial [Nanoarchaeota archaeon]|nr:LamG domain-containing protein [Nanoarchaeota archaeon]